MNSKSLVFSTLSIAFINGCSTSLLEGEPAVAPQQISQVMFEPVVTPGFHTHVMVSDYSERLAHDLLKYLNVDDLESPLVVTPFVEYDATLQKTNSLGRIISEHMVNEMNQLAVPVIDLHLMHGFMVNEEGEFVFSRNPDDFYHEGALKYVLTGVLIENERGVIVNARIMNFENQRVLASASVLIPPYVLAQ